ncbi:hypothetical protein BDR04DRAFT_1160437 [Suillus decipiens]|nr:hypothetical protein BDR04DRAFT_1160437 [Suillus decipiens]
MTSATQGAKLTPATVVVGMQGSINCIGDILEKAITAAPPLPPSSLAMTTLDCTMAIVQTEDAGVSEEELGQLLLIFMSNEQAMEIYVQSPPAACHSYVKVLLHSHMAKQM